MDIHEIVDYLNSISILRWYIERDSIVAVESDRDN